MVMVMVMATPRISFPLLFLMRLGAALVATLVLIWVMHFRGGMALFSNDKALIRNVHPVLMLIGFILLSGEAMLVFLLFGIQWIAGFATFWYPSSVSIALSTVLPWNAFLEIYIYGLAVATAETGLLERLTFLQTSKTIARYSVEASMVNCLGLVLALLSGCVILCTLSSSISKADVYRVLH